MTLDQAGHPVPEEGAHALRTEHAVAVVGPVAVPDVVDQPRQLQLRVGRTDPGQFEGALQAMVELAQPLGVLRQLRRHRLQHFEQLGERHVTPSGTRPTPPS